MKKMKKLSATLLSLVLALTILPVPAAKAANGPNTAADSFAYVSCYKYRKSDADASESHFIYSASGRDTETVTGFSYDKASNTVTLSNYNASNMVLEMNQMGDDLKLKLVGTNSVQGISVWGDTYGGSLQICGDGSLTVNADKSAYFAIRLRAETSNAKITVDNTVTLKAYAPEEHSAITVDETTAASDGITFTGRSDLNAKVKKNDHAYNEIIDAYIIKNNSSSYINMCTPKEASGLATDTSYGYSSFYRDKLYINVFKVERDENFGSIGYPILDSNGDIRDYSKEEFVNLFDYSGTLDDEEMDTDVETQTRVRVYEIPKDTTTMTRCIAIEDSEYDTSATYTYISGTQTITVDGTEITSDFINVYTIIENNGKIIAIPIEEGMEEINFADNFEECFTPAQNNSQIDVYRAYSTYRNICTPINDSTYSKDNQYVYYDSAEYPNNTEPRKIYVMNVVTSKDYTLAFPLLDNNEEPIDFLDNFDTYFKKVSNEPEESEKINAICLDWHNERSLEKYTKENDSTNYGVYHYYNYNNNDEVEVFDIYKLTIKNGFTIGTPVENGIGLTSMPAGYKATTGPTYYFYSYPESTLEITGTPAQTTTPTQQTTPEAPKQEATGTELKDTTSNATGKVTNPGTVVDGKIVGAEVSYTKATEAKAEVSIPATMKIGDIEYAVTSVEKDAFKGDKTITSVTVGENVKTIDSGAFSNCKNLKTVKIGGKVETIGNNAFAGNSKLTTVTMGNNVTTVGDKAFQKCTSLKKVTIPATVTKVGKDAFAGCTKMTTATIGKNVKSIGANAFSGNKKLKTITIKSTKVPTIGKNAFKGLPKNATIKVPKKLYKDFKKKLTSKTGFNSKTMKLKKV